MREEDKALLQQIERAVRQQFQKALASAPRDDVSARVDRLEKEVATLRGEAKP